MVLAAAPGTAITSLAGPSSTDRATALQNAGKVLARLHTAAAPGFWRPAADGTWPIRTWHKLMDGFIADRVSELDVIQSIGFTGIEVDRMLGSACRRSGTRPRR